MTPTDYMSLVRVQVACEMLNKSGGTENHEKKVFALLMAGIMTASLTACGSGSQDGADSQESAATEDTQGTEEASADQGEDAESSEGGETLTV